MSIKLRSGGIWKNVNKAYLRSGDVWKNITKAYIRSGGVWKSMFGFISSINDPSIAQQVTLVRSSASMPATLTGRNYRWTNATTLTYKFQYNNGSQWLDGNGTNPTGTITNPSVGSSNTKIYTPVIGDFPSSSSTSTGSFRFLVTATNTNVSPTLQTISTSDTVSIQNVINVTPVIPTISMTANTNVTQTSGTINWTSTNQASHTSTGTFSTSATPTATFISKSGLTAGTTYTGTVTVTSSTGNTASANYSLTTNALVSIPVNQTVPTVTPSTGTAGVTEYSTTNGTWTNSPTSFTYQWEQSDNESTWSPLGNDRNGNPSTLSTYSPVSNYVSLYPDGTLRCKVTATNSAGSASRESFPVEVVAPSTPSPSPSPSPSPTPDPTPTPTWYCSVREIEDGNESTSQYITSMNQSFCGSSFVIVCSQSGYPPIPSLPC